MIGTTKKTLGELSRFIEENCGQCALNEVNCSARIKELSEDNRMVNPCWVPMGTLVVSSEEPV